MTQHRIRTGPGSEEASLDLSGKLNEWLERSGPNGLFRTCGSCRQMQRTGPAHCLMFRATPPIDVILAGCDRHEDEAVAPFP